MDKMLESILFEKDESKKEDTEISEERMKVKHDRAAARKSKRYRATHKSEYKKALNKQKKFRKTAAGKSHMRKLNMMGKAKKGYRRTLENEDSPLHVIESLIRESEYNFSEKYDDLQEGLELVCRVAEGLKDFSEDVDFVECCDALIEMASEDLSLMEDNCGVMSYEDGTSLEERYYDLHDGAVMLFDLVTEDEDDDDFEDEDFEDEDFDEDNDEDTEEDEDFEDDDDDDDDDEDLEEAEAAKNLGRQKKSKTSGKKKHKTVTRRLLRTKGSKKVRGKSNYGNQKALTKSMVNQRKDVDSPQALLGYLKQVKLGKVAPGQPLAKRGTNK